MPRRLRLSHPWIRPSRLEQRPARPGEDEASPCGDTCGGDAHPGRVRASSRRRPHHRLRYGRALSSACEQKGGACPQSRPPLHPAGKGRSKGPNDMKTSASRKRQQQPTRELRADERLIGSAHVRRMLANQGTRSARTGQRFPPSQPASVELAACRHRARVLAGVDGYVPARARCPRCHRWRNTLPETARRALRHGSRIVVAERDQERDGRTFRVVVLATPRRARFGSGSGGGNSANRSTPPPPSEPKARRGVRMIRSANRSKEGT